MIDPQAFPTYEKMIGYEPKFFKFEYIPNNVFLGNNNNIDNNNNNQLIPLPHISASSFFGDTVDLDKTLKVLNLLKLSTVQKLKKDTKITSI